MSVLPKRTYKPADQRREQILDCALEVFAHKGYHGASIADVCARVGIGRATLYQYFDDKRDVLVALADRVKKRVLGAAEARGPAVIPHGFVPTEDQAVRFVERRLLGVLRAVFHDAPTTRLVLRAGRGADGVADDLLREIDAALVQATERDLAAAVEAGILRPLDVPLVARFFIGGIEKVALSHLDEGKPVDLEAIAREAATLELCGTLARRPASGATEAPGLDPHPPNATPNPSGSRTQRKRR
jgi:AcrR family transcriptional regulator